VRDLYDLGDSLMIVASDRISAFDVVMDQPVPGKGVVLTELTRFWLETLPACSPHHLEYVVDERVPKGYEKHADQLRRRAMVVHKAEVMPVECVVRGYLAGSGWKEYRERGSVCGVKLPAGLRNASKLPEPIFTPTTKADRGHDLPLSFDQACELAGRERMTAARDRALAIYAAGAELAEKRGIILADTKFEFGVLGGELLLIDEVLTPDSSRFWPKDEYRVGANPPSFDKQFLRDYLESLDWNKTPPPPTIPEQIITQSQARYFDAYRAITGQELRW
jgi:phosphoribosylaminoimidazole-succinocarboxamide synthase